MNEQPPPPQPQPLTQSPPTNYQPPPTPPPAPTEPSPPPPKPKVRLPQSVKLAILLFVIAGSLVAIGFPYLITNTGDQPALSLLFATGAAVILLTAGLFNYLARLGLGFSRSVWVLLLGYNAVIAVIKFILSPMAFYKSGRQGVDYINLDPNASSYYIVTAIFILLIYCLVFRMIYGHFRKSLLTSGLPRAGVISRAKEYSNQHKVLVGLSIAVIVLTGGGVLIIPFFVAAVAVPDQYAYLLRVFGALAVPLIVAVALAIYLAYKSFDGVAKQAVATGNAALLSTFFWVGLCLIAAYHVMWVVFMITLVSIWPFNTTASK